MKVKKFIKEVFIDLLILGALIGGYELLHSIATAQRGYEAVGGEIFVFLLPVIVWAFYRNIKDTKEIFKGDDE